MSERVVPVVSIFNAVDQAAMLDRLAESPLEDAEVGFLTDRDASGMPQVSQSLLAGIRIFAGLPHDDADDSEPIQVQSAREHVTPTVVASPGSRASFILFGPGGQHASAT
ncbi:MAG: hypothetical protein Q7K25_06395 [Actinomycetota bacterium]|nr:hypothetical protein [Actinomycetota bacterium]